MVREKNSGHCGEVPTKKKQQWLEIKLYLSPICRFILTWSLSFSRFSCCREDQTNILHPVYYIFTKLRDDLTYILSYYWNLLNMLQLIIILFSNIKYGLNNKVQYATIWPKLSYSTGSCPLNFASTTRIRIPNYLFY